MARRTKSDILALLPAPRLRELADKFDLGGSRRTKDQLVELFVSARKVPLEEVLNKLQVSELNEIAITVRAESNGRTKAHLIGAILGEKSSARSQPRRTSVMAKKTKKEIDETQEAGEDELDEFEELGAEDDIDSSQGDSSESSLEEGMILDYITGKAIKDSGKEQVRQRLARALFHEYGISVDDMIPDYRMKIDGRTKKVDIAIFIPGTKPEERSPETLRRVVICEKEPSNGKKSAYRMRDHEQAEKEFGLLHAAMTEATNCLHGLWTNGLEFFFFERKQTRFDTKFIPIGDWPHADESVGSRDVASIARMRRAEAGMLRTAFRRCHNFIHGNEGMPKDVAFWQFLYLIFCKMHDEKRSVNTPPRFWAGATEQFDEEGRKAIRKRVEPLFFEVKKKYKDIFTDSDQITLSNRALAFMVSELAKYDFGRTDVDAKGAAYQEIVGANLRGDRGQYFTPRSAIRLMVQILDPKPNERVMDPASGTGGFLVATIDHLNRRYHREQKVDLGDESTSEFLSIQATLADYVRTNLFAADFDPFLVRAGQMNVVMATNAEARVFHINSLEFPAGHLSGVGPAKREAGLGTMDIVMTNPPFGADIPVTDPAILRQFDLAHEWEKAEGGAFRNTGTLKGAVAPEILFIERCLQWLKPGGRMGIVLPNGILSNAGDEYIRWWMLRHAYVFASIDLPIETFVVDANVNILTSLLFLKKKTDHEMRRDDLRGNVDYPVFMAIAERVGHDRRGAPLYRRHPNGEIILEETTERETIRIGEQRITRELRRRRPVIDNDLPLIAEEYHRYINSPKASKRKEGDAS
jgi:type I restriction enzyme M protein